MNGIFYYTLTLFKYFLECNAAVHGVTKSLTMFIEVLESEFTLIIPGMRLFSG